MSCKLNTKCTLELYNVAMSYYACTHSNAAEMASTKIDALVLLHAVAASVIMVTSVHRSVFLSSRGQWGPAEHWSSDHDETTDSEFL